MEDILDRIARLTQVLRALHMPTFRDAKPADQDRILTHLLNARLGHELKTAVDLLSQFLWCYIESAAARTDSEVDYAQQSVRLGQVTEMLRLLHQSACPLRDSLAFVEHVATTVTRLAEKPSMQRALAMEKGA